jgi:hypothetical protein
MTFETIQNRLVSVLNQAEIKVGTKQSRLVEAVYVQALRDNGVQIPAAVDMMLLCGRSVAGYRDVGKREQLP